jgi:putative flavoprotein involved in K+ transport
METTELSPLQLSDDARGAVPTTTMISMPAERRPAPSQQPGGDAPPSQDRPERRNQREVVIVGAGQAALATAYYLRQAGVDVQLLERRSTVGASWSRRWDSLRLFTPARYDALPGLPFPGDPWSYPGKDDVAAYLAQYASRFELPVRTDAEVVALTGRQDAFELHLPGEETITARRVVVATGAFGTPYTPALSGDLGPNVVQVHTDDYRSPATLPAGPVLVVGGGNSGFQLAHELASSGRPVHLAEGTRLRTVRQRIAGRDLFWWLTTTRVIHAPAHTGLGRRLRANEPVIGTFRTGLRQAGVLFRPRVVSATKTTVTFVDGTSLAPSTVVWATGYRHDDRWISLPGALAATGALVTAGADTTIAGLHTIGRPWQRDRGSALLGFVHRDAQRLADRLTAALASDWVSTC